MKEQIKQIKNIVTEEQIIKTFVEKGIEDQESKELLLKYIDKCHTEADTESERYPDQANRINIETEIKIAELYNKIPDINYKNYAIESLEQIFDNAGNDELSVNLVERISGLIIKWKNEKGEDDSEKEIECGYCHKKYKKSEEDPALKEREIWGRCPHCGGM